MVERYARAALELLDLDLDQIAEAARISGITAEEAAEALSRLRGVDLLDHNLGGPADG